MRHLPQLQVRSWLWKRAEDSLHSIWVFVPSWMQPGESPSGPWLPLRHGKAATGQGRQGHPQPPGDSSWGRSRASQHGGEVELQVAVFCYLSNIEHRQYMLMPLPTVLHLRPEKLGALGQLPHQDHLGAHPLSSTFISQYTTLLQWHSCLFLSVR